jgi:N-carbamoylputrescine amidase
MKAALAVNPVSWDEDRHAANMVDIMVMMQNAAKAGADLVLFPEAALTGLINNDRPSHDLGLGIAEQDGEVSMLSDLARKLRLYAGIGLLEREGRRLYDSAFLFAPDGSIALKYRRITRGWHGKKAAARVYGAGRNVSKVKTPLGSFTFLICGDMFDERLVRFVRELKPDWLLVPFARCFEDGSCDQQRWTNEELPAYVEQVRRIGVSTLMTNYLWRSNRNELIIPADAKLEPAPAFRRDREHASRADRKLDSAFGGAAVIAGDGRVLASLPLGRTGLLLADL